jgi:aminoglycoside phosphotransferase
LGDDVGVDRLPHGYTNFTRFADGRVEKVYDGPRRLANASRELACLSSLGHHLPVAAVVEHDLAIPRLTLSLLPGRHGQDLIDEGYASRVLRLVGETLSALHDLAVDAVPGLVGEGSVIVHGDFGPQNMLFDLDPDRVTGVLDWESAHLGGPIEDLAWTEWLVRMHHPDAIDALDDLFAAAGQRPSWSERQTAMVRQGREVLAYCELAGMDRSAVEWRDRLRRTEAWTGE